MTRGGTRIWLLPKSTIAAAVLYAGATLIEWLVLRIGRVPRDVMFPQVGPGLAVLCCAAVAYGVARVVAYHPAFRPRYRQWMETVPWRPGMPLPLGPVVLNWRDALVLVPAALLAHYVSCGSAVALLLAFGAAHLAVLAMSEVHAGWWGFALLAGYAGLLRLSDYPLAVALAMVPLYGVALGGLRYGLPTLVKPPPDAKGALGALGAPFEQLSPIAPPKPVRAHRAFAGAAMAGWWAYCLTWRFWPVEANVIQFSSLVFVFGLIAALVRFGEYRAGSSPPLSFGGRWRTGRWINPEYDTVYLMPLLTFVVALASAAFLLALGAGFAITAGVSVGLTVFTAVVLPPTRARWRLTSPRRIDLRTNPGGSSKQVKLGA